MKLKNSVIHKSYIFGLLFILIQANFFVIIIFSHKNVNQNFLLILMIILNLLYIIVNIGLIFIYLKHENQKEIIKKMDEYILNLRKQRHDFLNHLQVIYVLIDCDEKDEALNYLKSIEASVKNKSLVYKTNDPHIGAVLSAFAMKADSKGIRFDLYGLHDFSKFPLSPIHAVTVLSNLLKNAIENCEKNGCIYMETEIVHSHFYLKISNDGKPIEIIGENPSDWNKQIYQGKSIKGENRGAGMLIIKEILSQYDDCNLFVLNRTTPSFMLKLKMG